MFEVLYDVGFGLVWTTTGATSAWVDFFVTKCGASAGNYGTHLAKATLLSRAATAAMS